MWLNADDGVLLVGCAGQPGDGSPATDAEGQLLEVGRAVAVARVAVVSEREAWLEGIRVDPRVRGMEVATDLQVAELHWTAAQRTDVVRYATGERNEGSHRLGARHGFELVAAFRTYWWKTPGTPGDDDEDEDESGFGEEARRQASRRRAAALDRLGTIGLVASRAGRWWPRLAADPTFAAGRRLYEHRAWALQELTEEAFRAHVRAGEVLVSEAAAGGWALAIFEREAWPAEDVSLHLGLLAGDGPAALELASAVREATGQSIRFRLPGEEPPLMHGQAERFAAAGFARREWTLHILARDGHQEPPAIDPARLFLQDEPRRLLI